jgi:phosphoribosylanthranilate isomerase
LARYLAECEQSGRAPDVVLIDADGGVEFGGTGKTANWELVAEQRSMLRGLPMILAGGLRPENVSEAIAAVRPIGVDVASGVESGPGIKDHELMRQFVRAASSAFELP